MNSGKYQIIIDSSSRIFYASYYIQGLMDVFGKKNCNFSKKEFLALKRSEEEFAFEHYFAFLLQSEGISKKIIVDFCDPIDINHAAYAWCDLYAKVNYNKKLTPEKYHQKSIAIAPGFGIQIWNKWETLAHSFSNLSKNKFKSLTSIKRFFQDYNDQYKRPKIQDYEENEVANSLNAARPKYVFSIGNLWKEQDVMTTTNNFRKQFMWACKDLQCDFEGGFYTTSKDGFPKEYQSLLFEKHYKSSDYVTKTKESKVVFNTPAVHQCHGWKLGEYLAMGKAIISTPLSNDVPFPLEHSKNIHIVSNENELRNAIELVLQNTDYRESLEKNTKEYYENYASPKAVINSIVTSVI